MNLPVRHVYEVYIRTTPEKLWDALTDGEQTRKYFFDGILQTKQLAVGTPMTYRRADSGELMTDGEVLEIDRPRKLVQTWRAAYVPADKRDGDSRITWEITPLGATCKLTVVHEHASADTATAQGTVRGWSMILSG
ncbi:MAG TPA: SRPBCC family protein, partial [Candidatus Acidoferrum sp.]|nr:SRPBCC family protein [Candidatus Acidoferrum sp.]